MNIVKLFIFLLIFSNCSSVNRIKYFDIDNKPLSRSEYVKKKKAGKYLEISGDSTNHKTLTVREKRGQVYNLEILYDLLEKELQRKLNRSKPLVIIYYPGKDKCNSTGTTNKEWISNYYSQLEEGLNQIAEIKPIYLYKDKNGLEKYSGILEWHKDPENAVEELFFEYHYPCDSFVVISKEGKYICYFGEFSKEYVWEAAEILAK